MKQKDPKPKEQQDAARVIMERRYRNPDIRKLALFEWLITEYRSSRKGG